MSNKFTLSPSRYDSRDQVYTAQNVSLKEYVDLRPFDTAVEDQGDLGSCVGSALVSAYELMLNKNYTDKFIDLSKLYIYYHARLLEDSERFDEGVEDLRSGLRGLHKFGVCNETLWPYNNELLSVQPGLDCYIDAWPRKILTYQSLTTTGDMLEILNAGIPITIGLTLFDSFYYLTPTNPVVYAPKDSVSYYGGHAMCLVGYSLSAKWFIAKNSWGIDWGDKGYCYIPFDYMRQFSFDRWFFNLECNS